METATIEYDYVDTPERLATAVAKMKQAPELGVDTECENNLHHYGVYLAIIQISTETENWIIDTLALDDLTPLKEVFEDPTITIIFHDVNFDLRVLNTEYDIRPKNIFDTRIAAQFLGKEKNGLGALLEEYFSIEKESKFQRVDWTRRPLSKEMVSYAVKDSKYLIPLKHKMEEELKALGRLEWVREECEHAENLPYHIKTQEYHEVKGYQHLNDKEKSAFENIFKYREQSAEKLDKPPFQVIRPKQMLDLVHKSPSQLTSADLKGSHPYIRSKIHKIKELVYSGLQSPKHEEEKEVKRLSKEKRNMRYYLDDLRKEIAEQLELAPAIILTNDQILELVLGNRDAILSWQKKILLEHAPDLMDKLKSL